MADDNPHFPGLKMPKSKPEERPTIVPKSQGTGGVPQPPVVMPNNEHFPGLIMPKGPPKEAPASENSFFYDLFHPSAADLNRPQTWRDWATKTYSPTGQDWANAAIDDFTFGGADYARSKATGENIADLRARTANSQAALGPMGPVVNALTYAVPGLGESKLAYAVPGKVISKTAGALAPKIGRYGAAAAEGGTASGLSSAVHQAGGDTFDVDKVVRDTIKGAALGIGAQGLGDVTAPGVQRVADRLTGKPGRQSEAWDWRQRAGMDDPTLPSEVAYDQAFWPPNHPAQPGLAKLQGALAQSTQPGLVADATTAGAGLGLNYMFGDNSSLANWVSSSLPGIASRVTVNPIARGINTYERNINVGQALDQLYPALYGKPSTTNVSGWADALRNLTVGGQRPNEGNAQWW